MTRLLIVLFLFTGLLPVFAQDEITFRTGETLQARILEIKTNEVVYKKFDNLSGPSYTVKKDQVFMIKYENGTKDVFGAESSVTVTPGPVAPSAGNPAIIYFYRPRKALGSIPEIIVGTFVPDEVIVKLSNGNWFKSEYGYTGQRAFVTGIYSLNGQTLNVNIESSKTYYIRCSIMKGIGMQSQIELVDEATAMREMKGLKEQKSAK